jgi:uncharacterized cupredoxin-like copper-binding protein
MRTWIVGAVVLIAAVAAGCGPRAPQPAATPPPAPTEAAQSVEVIMRDFAFEPRTIQVRAGTVQFVLINQGAVEHDFVIPGLEEHGVHEQHVVAPGQTLAVTKDLRPGTYEVICTIPGHKEAGMVGTIEVIP